METETPAPGQRARGVVARVWAAVAGKDGDEVRTGSVVFRGRMTAPQAATATWSGSRLDP